jgi:hypothetical protein
MGGNLVYREARGSVTAYENIDSLQRYIDSEKNLSELSLPAALTLTVEEWQIVEAALCFWLDDVPLGWASTANAQVVKYKVQYTIVKALEN